MGGSLAFFMTAFGLCQLLLNGNFQNELSTPLLIAAVATIAEFFGGKGYDNITIPVGCMTAMYFLQTQTLIHA